MLMRFTKSHTPYLAGETAEFPDAQAAALRRLRVAEPVADDRSAGVSAADTSMAGSPANAAVQSAVTRPVRSRRG